MEPRLFKTDVLDCSSSERVNFFVTSSSYLFQRFFFHELLATPWLDTKICLCGLEIYAVLAFKERVLSVNRDNGTFIVDFVGQEDG